MWIIFKLMMIVGAALLRMTAKTFGAFYKTGATEVFHDGQMCYVQKIKGKHQNILQTRILVPFHCKFVFKLTRENALDRFFKNWGLASEIQSGDHTFDDKIYIACDSYLFAQKISANPQVRELFLALFESGCQYIRANGQYLIVQYKGDVYQSSLSEKAVQLSRLLFDMNIQNSKRPIDLFAFKATLIEAMIWSIAAYASSVGITWVFHTEDIHLFPQKIFATGITTGLILAGVFLFFVIQIMKGSSRSHRILVESAFVLFLSLPFVGIGLISDDNIAMDRNPSIVVKRPLIDKQMRKHRSRGRTNYSYHLYFGDKRNTYVMDTPDSVRVSKNIYDQAQIGKLVEIEIGPGHLKHPWYRGFHFSE